MALNDMVRYYDAMSEQEKSLGSFTYADYPPVEMDNAITRAYDKVMPGWRKGANQPKPPRDPEADKKILAHLRPMMEAINAQRAKVKRRAERNF